MSFLSRCPMRLRYVTANFTHAWRNNSIVRCAKVKKKVEEGEVEEEENDDDDERSRRHRRRRRQRDDLDGVLVVYAEIFSPFFHFIPFPPFMAVKNFKYRCERANTSEREGRRRAKEGKWRRKENAKRERKRKRERKEGRRER